MGGGPAGLYSALLLKRADPRHEVTVYEREPQGAVRGWGVTFWDDLLAAMRGHDAESAAAVAQAATGWTGLETYVEGQPAVSNPEFWGHSIARATLIQILEERAREVGVELSFDTEVVVDDLSEQADLVICADGVNSRFRRQHADQLGTSVDIGRNRFAWLATPRPFPAFRFAFTTSRAGWLCCYAYAYGADASTFVVELPPETFDALDLAVLSPAETTALLAETFAWQLDGQPLLVQPDADGTMPWRQFPTIRNRSWHLGNVALLGDAAHTAHYSIGFGTKLALEDAMALASAVGDVAAESDVPAALRRYQESRQREVARTQRDADFSRRWFEHADRYLGLPVDDFSSLLDRRRSPLVAYLPPALLVGARRVVKRTGLARRLRSLRGG